MKALTDEERLKLAERDRFIDQLSETIDNDKDTIDFKTASIIHKKLHTVAYNNLKEQGKIVERIYPTASISNKMYEGVLKHTRIDSDTTIESVVSSVIEDNNVDSVFWEQCRKEPYGKDLAKSVVENHEDHPEYRRIKKNIPIDIYKLKGAKTLNNQIASLVKYKRASDNLENMKDAIRNQEYKIGELESKVDILGIDLKRLMILTGLPLLTDKQMASELKHKGYSQDKIAATVGKGIATIKRWWDEL